MRNESNKSDLEQKAATSSAIRTVVKLDMKSYSILAQELEAKAKTALAVLDLHGEIADEIDNALSQVGSTRAQALINTAGDGGILGFETAEQAHAFTKHMIANRNQMNAQCGLVKDRRFFRFAITTGEVASSPIVGVDDAGDTIIRASRLEPEASLNGILIDHATYQKLPPEVQNTYAILPKRVEVKHGEQIQAYDWIAVDAEPRPENLLADLSKRLSDGSGMPVFAGAWCDALFEEFRSRKWLSLDKDEQPEKKRVAVVDLTVNAVTQRFRWIEAGAFSMGSPEKELDRQTNEGPQHRVRISQGFWFADTTCSQAFWLALVGGKNPAHFKNDLQNPVEQVSWNDVTGSFLSALNSALPDALEATLPSEAQWEYACRAGTDTPFSFGTNITPAQVNYNGNHPYADGAKGEYRKSTIPVKSLAANAWGLYQLHGNVLEWCRDGRREYPSTSEVLVDPEGPVVVTRAVRGGCWINDAWFARAAFRDAGTPESRDDLVGFRLLLRSREPSTRPARGARAV